MYVNKTWNRIDCFQCEQSDDGWFLGIKYKVFTQVFMFESIKFMFFRELS